MSGVPTVIFFISVTKSEWWASSTFNFYEIILFAIGKKNVLLLSYLHKFKMVAREYHLVLLCYAIC